MVFLRAECTTEYGKAVKCNNYSKFFSESTKYNCVNKIQLRSNKQADKYVLEKFDSDMCIIRSFRKQFTWFHAQVVENVYENW